MRVNNFKELEREIMQNREGQVLKVKNELTHTRGVFQFIGDLLELFIPRFFDSLIGSSENVAAKQPPSKYPHEN